MNCRFGITILLLGVCLGGCSPKRVSSSGVAISPVVSAPVPEKKLAPDVVVSSDQLPKLPDPKPISRSGAAIIPTGPKPKAVLGSRAVELAKDQLGKPYQWGATGPQKFDCSGLVQYVYKNLGVSLPRVSGQQAGAGVHVDRKDLQPGDLVFFKISGVRIDHVGIYVGRGKFIHAPGRHSPVRTDSLNDSWWRRKFKGGRRVG